MPCSSFHQRAAADAGRQKIDDTPTRHRLQKVETSCFCKSGISYTEVRSSQTVTATISLYMRTSTPVQVSACGGGGGIVACSDNLRWTESENEQLLHRLTECFSSLVPISAPPVPHAIWHACHAMSLQCTLTCAVHVNIVMATASCSVQQCQCLLEVLCKGPCFGLQMQYRAAGLQAQVEH